MNAQRYILKRPWSVLCCYAIADFEEGLCIFTSLSLKLVKVNEAVFGVWCHTYDLYFTDIETKKNIA